MFLLKLGKERMGREHILGMCLLGISLPEALLFYSINDYLIQDFYEDHYHHLYEMEQSDGLIELRHS